MVVRYALCVVCVWDSFFEFIFKKIIGAWNPPNYFTELCPPKHGLCVCWEREGGFELFWKLVDGNQQKKIVLLNLEVHTKKKRCVVHHWTHHVRNGSTAEGLGKAN